MTRIIKSIKRNYLAACQKSAASFYSPTEAQGRAGLFILGIALLGLGMNSGVDAQGLTVTYNDTRIADSVNGILTYIEGSFGALVMISAGLGAIISSAFGQYRAALGLLVVAVGAFILRSLVSTFFNDTTLRT